MCKTLPLPRVTVQLFMMIKKPLAVIVFSLSAIFRVTGGDHIVVADRSTRMPLPGASVFDRTGKGIGMADSKGRLPYIGKDAFPVTVRYLGFREKYVPAVNSDTVFLTEITTDLPEVLVESKHHKVLHMLGYVREYSTLSTYTDTVFLFREKMVDYMITPDKKMRFKGWLTPRVLKSKSYYRFTNAYGLDSVSDKCNNHFSWSDWIGIVTPPALPCRLKGVDSAADTVRGKYSPTEIWNRKGGRVRVDVNVLADTASRKWVPDLSAFFRKHLDFENFKVSFSYDNLAHDSLLMTDLKGYSLNIESNGRGHEMFRFNRRNEPFCVNTFAEVYILDKEYITVKEAKKWDKRRFGSDDFEIIEASDAPDLLPPIRELIARVDGINHTSVRLDFIPDHRLVGRQVKKQNFGERALSLLKQLTGITYFRSRRNFNDRWNKFRREQTERNRSIPVD